MIKIITFRLDEAYLDKLSKVAKKLKLEDRSHVIRLFLDEGIAKHLQPGFRGEITAVNTKALDNILTGLSDRIRELESPKEQSYEEAEKAARRVDELRKQGKGKEADRIVNERAKKGLWTGYAYWPEAEKKP
jgi:uncharacterized protein (UPF0305 family)